MELFLGLLIGTTVYLTFWGIPDAIKKWRA